MWRRGVGMGGARLSIQLCGWQCVYWRQPSSKCMPWQAKLKSIIWIIHTRTQNKTQLSRLHYTPFSFSFSSCLLAAWLPALIFVCLIMTKLLTNIPVNRSVLGITDNTLACLTLLSIWSCLHSWNSPLTQGTTHLFVGLVFCFLPGLPFFLLYLKYCNFLELCPGSFYLILHISLPDARWLQPFLPLAYDSQIRHVRAMLFWIHSQPCTGHHCVAVTPAPQTQCVQNRIHHCSLIISPCSCFCCIPESPTNHPL